MNFIKNIFSSFIGSLLAIVLGGFLAGIFLVIGIASSIDGLTDKVTSSKSIDLGANNFLRISLNKQISEYEEPLPFQDMDLPYGIGKTGQQGLIQVIKSIEQATHDDQIKGVYLNVTGIFGGFAQVKEIRDKLLEFKELSGKPIYAYSEMMTEKGYYLSSVADEVYLTPEGILEFNGLSAEVMYYKQLFDKLEVKPRIFKVGKYKSAVEPYFRDSMSEANREQISSFIESMYDGVITEIALSRNMDKGKLREISDEMLVRNVHLAVDYELIDGAMYYDEVILKIKQDLELSADDKITFISSGSYVSPVFESDYSNKIGVVVAEGTIQSGKSSDGVLGANTFIKNLKEARDDDNVKAIVVRINSPGGSALASDVMWREIRATADVKPVVASMSSVAASGGYYMAMACDDIVAEPLTVTGSIGVFGVLFTLDDFLEHKLGITTDRVKTGKFSDLGSVTRDIAPADSMIIQKEVERIYDIFTKKAAESRGMEQSELQKLAGGRVYSGYEAIDVGLIDTLGSLQTAVVLAAGKVGLDDYGVSYFAGEEDVWKKFTGMKSSLEEDVLKEKLGTSYKTYQILKSLESKKGVQAIMPFEITVE